MLDNEKADAFILSMNKAIIKCCKEFSANPVEALSAVGEIFMYASVSIGLDPDAFDVSLKILSEAFRLILEERTKKI